MAILVTGGAGYIGSHTVVELLLAGEEVIIVDNFYNAKPAVLTRIHTITKRQPIFYELDVSDEQALTNVFQKHTIHAVIHFAGYKAVGESVEKPVLYYQNNLNTTLTLLKVMLAFKVYGLVFSSSATVYGNPSKMPIVETDPVGGTTNPYGTTKLMNEMIIADACKANPSLKAIMLRYFNPIGSHPSGLIGEEPQGIPNNLLPYITQTAAGKRDFLTVYGVDYNTPDGSCVRDYIHVADLAEAHVAALNYMNTHNISVETFNLGTGTGTSVLEMIRFFDEISGMKLPYKVGDRRSGDVPAIYANTDKAEEILGWKAQRTVKDAIRDAWNYEQQTKEV
jgi:UDP-glucose 4-epimerase